MSDELGMVQLAPRENPYLGGQDGYAGEKPFSEETAAAIDAEVLQDHRREPRRGAGAC